MINLHQYAASGAQFRATLSNNRTYCIVPPSTVWLTLSGIGLALAIALRMTFTTDPDVSWLLYVAERIRDGATAYRDLLEVNPPASFLIYTPSVMIARLSGLSPEFVTNALMFFAAGSCLTICNSILAGTSLPDKSRAAALLSAAVIVLLILPLKSFAQREHIVVLAVLPILACFAARAGGQKVGAANVLFAGIGAGIMISVKPFFALALVGPGIYLLGLRTRPAAWRMPELWLAWAIVAVYGLSVVLIYPDFADRVLPLVMQIYVPARAPFPLLLISTTVWIYLALICTFRQIGKDEDRFGNVLTLASVGFEACFFIQGKGFAYHAYPAIALAALGCAVAICRPGEPKIGASWTSVANLGPAVVAVMIAMIVYARPQDPAARAPGLEQAVASIAAHPDMLTIGSQMPMGRALAREIGAEWVGSTPVAWITFYAGLITLDPESDERFADPIRRERELYAKDIAQRRPRVVLIDGDEWLAWALRSPALARELSGYREVGRYGTILLLSRVKSSAEPNLGGSADIPRPHQPTADPG